MSFAPKQFIRSVDFLSTENATNTSTGSVNIYGGMSVSKDSYLTNMIVVGNSTLANVNITGALTTSNGNSLISSQWTSIDSNTDIYFGTSANSFVGIGTTTPGFNLDISGGSRITGGLTVGNLNVNTGASITNILNTTICTGTVIVTAGSIRASFNSHTIGSLVTTGGNVGIGTTAPGSRLEVNGTLKANDITVGNINFTGNLFQNGTAYLGSQWTTTSGNTLTYTSGNVSVNSGFTSSFNSNTLGSIITTGGNVGIGTTSPNYLLTLTGQGSSANLGPSIAVYNTGNNLPIYHQLNYASDNITLNFDSYYDGSFRTSSSYTAYQISKQGSKLWFNYATGTTGSVADWKLGMILVSNGNVGIGSGSPSASLQIYSTSGTSTLIVGNFNRAAWNSAQINVVSNGTVGSGIAMERNGVDTAVIGNILGNLTLGHQNGAITFNSGIYDPTTALGTERMRITSSGNVGIGTTAPTTTLDVSGTARITTSLTTGALFSTNQTTTNIVATNSTFSNIKLTDNSAINLDAVLEGRLALVKKAGFLPAIAIANNSDMYFQVANNTDASQVTTNTYTTIMQLKTSGQLLISSLSSGNIVTTNITIGSTTTIQATTNNYSLTSGALNITGDIVLSGNEIMFTTTGVGAPILNGRGSGSKIVLYPETGATRGDYSIGVESAYTWFQVPSISSHGFKFYQGTTANVIINPGGSVNILNTANITTISSGSLFLSGNLSVAGTLTTVNITSTNLVNTNVSAGVVVASTLLSATGNSNTIGNVIYTTGGSVGMGTIPTTNTLLHLFTSDATNTLFVENNGGGSGFQPAIRAKVNALSAARNILQLENTSGIQMIFRDDGCLGIGTTSPSQKLDVIGGIKAGGSSSITQQGAHLQWNRTGGDGETWIINQKGGGNANSGIRFGKSDTSNAVTELMRIQDTGNVGIGTAAPTAQLNINNDFSISANNAAWNTTAGKGIFMRYSTNSGQDSAYIQSMDRSTSTVYPMTLQAQTLTFSVDANGTSKMFINTSGNIGIGTTTPSRMLSLNGPTTNITAGPHLWINTSDQANPVFQMLNWSADNVSMNFDMYYNGAFRNSGSSTAWQIYKSNSQIRFMYQNGTAGSSNGQTNCLVLGSTGNVGIMLGNGIHLNSASSINNGTYSLHTVNSGSYPIRLALTDDAALQRPFEIGYYTSNNATSTWNSKFYVNGYSGNVGIGTQSPAYTLDISGTTKVTNTSSTSMGTFIVSGPNSSSPATATSGQLASFYGAGGSGAISNIDLSTYLPGTTTNNLPAVRFSMLDLGAANSTFNILTRNSGSTGTMGSRIFIDGSGNIGIGTTSPGNLLTIQGSGTTGTLSFHNATNPVPYVGIGYHQTADGLAFYYNNASSSLNSIGMFMTRYGTGSVGIGTTSPRSNLEITQTSTTTGVMLYSGADDAGINSIFFNHSATSSAYQKVAIQTRALGNGQFARSHFGILVNTAGDSSNVSWSDAKLFIHGSSGNVGIGTTNPQNSLQIHNPSATPTTLFTRYSTNISGGGLNFGEIAWKSTQRANINAIIRSTSQVSDGLLGWDDAGRLEFLTQPGASTPIIRMVISESGNIGIGTTTPLTRLSVQGGGLHVVGNTAISSSDLQGAHILWNRSGGEGETWLVNQPGLGAGSIRFGTSNTSNNLIEWMRLSSSGSLGLGTTSPQTKLHVEDGSVFIGDASAGFSTSVPSSPGWTNGSNGYRLFFDNSVNGTNGTGMPANKIVLHNNNWTCGFGVEVGGVTYHSGLNHKFYNGTSNSSTYGSLIFDMGGNSNIFYANTNGEANLKITNTNAGSSAYSIFRLGNNVTDAVMFLNSSTRTLDGGANNMTIRNDAGALRLQGSGSNNTLWLSTGANIGIGTTTPSYPLHVSGDIYATGDVISFSDARLKTDVVTIENALDKVSGLRGVYYTNTNTNTRETGVIAQEIAEILPEVVADKGEYLGVAYGNIVGLLIEAIKELKVRVSELENR